MSKVTPMIQQYLEIKESYRDAILFYRMGDFYEMFFEDAVIASRELEITLTSRDKQAEDPVPMCGVPHHAVSGYIAKLLERDYKVALCEQVEDPRQAKGLVRREVVRLITPGTLLDSLDGKSPNYLAAVHLFSGDKCGLAFLDLSTADFRMTQTENITWLLEELRRIEPRELLVAEDTELDSTWWHTQVGECVVQVVEPEFFEYPRAQQRLLDHFQVHSLEGFGVRNRCRRCRSNSRIREEYPEADWRAYSKGCSLPPQRLYDRRRCYCSSFGAFPLMVRRQPQRYSPGTLGPNGHLHGGKIAANLDALPFDSGGGH